MVIGLMRKKEKKIPLPGFKPGTSGTPGEVLTTAPQCTGNIGGN